MSTSSAPASGAGSGAASAAASSSGATAASTNKINIPPLKNLNETIQQRLLTGVGSKGGSRGSLTRVAAKYGAFWSKLQQVGKAKENKKKEDKKEEEGKEETTTLETLQQECQDMKEDLKREILLFQIEMNKWILMLKSHQNETAARQEHLDSSRIPQSKLAIAKLRQESTKSCRVRQCWEEYERLAVLARKRSPRKTTVHRMNLLEQETKITQQKLYETEFASRLREKQFQLLIQCMLDLKHSFNEEILIPPPEQQQQQEKEQEEQKQQSKQQPQKQTLDKTKDVKESADDDKDKENSAKDKSAKDATATSTDDGGTIPMEEDDAVEENVNMDDDGLYSDL